MKQFCFFSFLLLINTHYIYTFKINVFYAPKQLAGIELYFTDNNFCINKNGFAYKVKKRFVDIKLRAINEIELKNFLDQNYLVIEQEQDNEFSVKAKIITGLMAEKSER